jgi:precorrin-6B C5,15-methyltransferase / cobalt-precorrin-6B C5,C15-methyltransferase
MREKSLRKANKLHVIGIGYRPLGKRAQELVRAADVILASSRLFDVFKRYDEYEAVKDCIKVINKVPDTIAFIKDALRTPSTGSGQAQHSALRTIVLLASGDPLFFGIGRRMREEFGKEAVEILPDLSSLQEAFARINEAWDDAVFISLHGGPDIAKRRALPYEAADIPMLLERSGKMGILTDRENNPSVVAKVLNSAFPIPNSALVMYVCERLGYPDERITQGTPAEIAAASFSDPNVVIIVRDRVQGSGGRGQETRVTFGLREDEIDHERGLITKDEVRAVTLHKLRLPQNGVLWDIGAGSGSVSLEAAGICPGLTICAVEKEDERINTIRKNALQRRVGNVRIVHGSAPEALQDLPDPDRVFIGGSGGNLGEIIRLVNEKMPAGVVVINAASLDTLSAALTALDANGFRAEVAEISVSRSKVVAGKRLMSALNPVFIIRGEKG